MPSLPISFIWRRLHSLAGVFLVIYLIFHLLTNSQAALLIGQDGLGFIHDVNWIHDLPYLIFIELILLGVPFAIHMIWGLVYLFTSESNDRVSDGTTPALPQYERNHAYTWQRVTSWLLLVGIVAHVLHMRIYEYPTMIQRGSERFYLQHLSFDPGLYTLAARLDVTIYNQEQVQKQLLESSPFASEVPTDILPLVKDQHETQQQNWVKALKKYSLQEEEVLAVAKDFGTATLLLVRDTFKNPWMAILYTIFVIASCYHAFNGLWTSMITWGITLNPRIQTKSLYFCWGLMLLVTALGLAAIWGTFWINLKA